MPATAPLLTTKLYIPRARPSLVSRPRLTAQLAEGLTRPLTLISAPAGFGKTTLLAEWIQGATHFPSASHIGMAWLSLDAGDNDPTRFWTYFIAALQTLNPRLGADALALLQSPQPPPLESILTRVLNDLADFQDEFALVLDDYHVIDSQPVHEALAFAIDHLPPPSGMRLILASRADPPLPLARFRARGQLVELRAEDLRFTPDEAAEFLNRVMGLGLPAAHIATLGERTEGWIAGLQLAALSMRGRADLTGFIQAFTGSHAYVVDYLADEVLRQQPAEVEQFLLRTAILDRLSGPLCDAVAEQTHSQAMLERLERDNLFLVPLDVDRQWYRYHQLFADVLRSRLRQTQHAEIPNLHRRASSWFQHNGLLEEAVQHALAGADYAHAMQLIEGIFEASLQKGAILNLLRWMNAIPTEHIRTRPRLCLAYAWSLSAWTSAGDRSRSWEAIEAWTQAALQALSPEDSGADTIRAEVLVIRANVASIREDFALTADLSQRALEYLTPDSSWRNLMTMLLGEAHLMVGDAQFAEAKLSEASAMSRKAGSNDFWMLITTHLADAKVVRGQLRPATTLYQQVVDYAAKSRQPLRRASMAYSGLANILYEHNRLDEALAYLRTGREIIEQAGGSLRSTIVNAIPLARAQQAQGNTEAALATLTQLEELAHREQVHPLTRAMIAAYYARIHLAQGDLPFVAGWVSASGLSKDDARPDAIRPASRAVEYTTLVRFYLRTGEAEAAPGLLERLIHTATAMGRAGHLVELYMLQAVAYSALRETPRALAALEVALTHAEPEGYIRTFVDEGEPVRVLLKRLAISERLRAYVGKLLVAFTDLGEVALASPSSDLQSQLAEPLTDRELEVLRLVAEGLSDRQMAERMTVVVGTVKRHLNNLYGKLGVHSRTQALARARELGLV